MTEYTLDSLGNRVAVTNPLGKTTHFERDAWFRVTASIDPEANTTSTQFDVFGNVTQVTYNDLNWLVTEGKVYSGGTANRSFSGASDGRVRGGRFRRNCRGWMKKRGHAIPRGGTVLMSSASLFSNCRVAMSVDHRKELNEIACNSKDDEVWETSDGADTCSAMDDRELLSIRLNSPCGILDFVKEFHPQALSLPLVPVPCVTQVLPTGRSEEEVSTQSICLNSLKTSSAGIRLSVFESASEMR